ncbi:MAG: T9SS type A sorting domain-containing protein [Ignavibacteria bacterium]|nr:T9SS type A sorting domain-containing protein [Ignavibacteria bacterium]
MAQKSLVFELNATTPFRAPFYLGDGSHDIAVKNSIIRNAASATPSYASSLPSINFVNNTFSYQADVRSGSVTYSAGIVSRQKLPLGRDGNNSERLDTIPGSNNTFLNNEISGFGYGIVSMGIGMAIKSNVYQGFYTKGSQISGNTITNVRTAGIFVGYDDGGVISGNRIYNVGIQATGGTNVDAAGIVAGGVNRYNNTNLKIRGNEISGVVGDLWSRGISVEQVRNSFPSITAGGNTYFPNIPEATQITNNAIWGIRRQASTTNLSAIHLFTQRSTTLTGWNQIITPSLNNNQYFTRNDAVYNNTIVLTNDNIVGTGLVAGVGVQHASGASIKNNAFVMQNGASASTLNHSTLFYQGVQMTDGNDPMALVCDRNAYENGEATMARFVEINANSDVISQGSAVEFKFLSQWRSWTKRDINSVEGTISSDMAYGGVAPNQRLRVKTNPTPIGSLLNNRGERLSVITTDIDGAARGSAGQPFDIGADEFDGRQYVKDLEAAAVVSPSKYRAATGTLSDAEYVMTQTPISITGLVRNIGGLPQTNTPIRLRVYLETPASNNGALATAQWNSSPVVDRIVNATINSGDEANVVYDLTWVPQSYQQLAGMGYVVPARLFGMANNISPRYRIEISVSSDEYTPNNAVNKVVRFFVARSNVRMLATARGASVDLYSGTPTQNQIASRLNIDSVTYTLERIGYANNPAGSVIAYDVLDRDNFEERAIDYSIYRTVFWSSDNNPLTRFERRDLRAYVASGTALSKKNLAIAGQNYPRQHVGMDVINDQAFIQSVLRVNNVPPGNPVPTALTYHNRRLRGDAITRNSVETLFRTGFPGDAEPLPALVRMYSDPTSAGVAQRAYNYVLGDRQTTDSIMGSATASLVSNVVYLGVDWRFYRFTGERTGTERVIRGIFDFFESNGGGMVSAELTAFDAKARGNNVDVMWNTASETNSDHFDVERADVMAGSDAAFATVGTVASAGVSSTSRDYNFRDLGLASGRYLYRLTTVDKDGSRSVSNEVEVVIGAGGQATIGNVSPQPATSNASVEVTMVENGIATVEIIDASGARVALMSDVRLNAGSQMIDIPVNTLVSGAYTVVVSANGTTLTTPLVIRR